MLYVKVFKKIFGLKSKEAHHRSSAKGPPETLLCHCQEVLSLGVQILSQVVPLRGGHIPVILKYRDYAMVGVRGGKVLCK